MAAQSGGTGDTGRDPAAMGRTGSSRSLDGGQSLWIYEKREQQSGNRYAAPGMWCDEYALTFDRQGTLHHWTHRSYFHGGELMPRECIPETASKHPS